MRWALNSLGRREKSDKQSIFTRETLGVVLILFSTLLTVCLITREKVFYSVGKAVNAFLFGCFGYFAFAVMAYLFIKGIMLVALKKSKFNLKFKAFITITFFVIALLGQVISVSANKVSGYGEYLKHVYNMADAGGITTCSAGGLFTGILAYPLNKLLNDVGAYVVFSVLILISGYFAVREFSKKAQNSAKKDTFRGSFSKKSKDEDLGIEYSGEIDYPVMDAVPTATTKTQTQKLFVSNAEDFQMKSKRELSKDNAPKLTIGKTDGGLYMGGFGNSYSQANSAEMQKKIEYIKTPAKLDFTPSVNTFNTQKNTGTTVSNYIPLKSEQNYVKEEPIKEQPKQIEREIPMYYHEEPKKEIELESAKSHAEHFADKYAEIEEISETEVSKIEPTEVFRPIDSSSIASVEQEREEISNEDIVNAQEIFEQLEEIESASREEKIDEILGRDIDSEEKEKESEPEISPIIRDRRARSIFGEQKSTEEKTEEIKPAFDSRVKKDNNEFSGRREPMAMGFGRELPSQEQSKLEEKPKKPAPPINRVYNAPPLDLLESYDSRIDDEGENHAERMEIIRRTLENFHINTEPVGYIQGPTVTRYELRMPQDVSVKKVVNLADDLKMRLQSYDGIRIQAPVPGKDVIGIEVSNKHPVTVGLRELLETSSSKPAKPGSLMFAVGKDVVGSVITDNLVDGPHYLVAGGTNSGKSVCLNVMILSMIMRYSPEELQLILIDPKMVEFTAYEHLPHLVSDEIISEPKRAIAAFQWAIEEMERRYELISKNKVSNIIAYNSQVANDKIPKIPRLVIVVDELSNLMETCKKDMEAKILSLAQKARAAGIHLVLATQRPSVDIITGTIKANLPSRIALRLSNYSDSNTIISEAGAEKLLGRGDMLYKNGGMNESARYQGAFLSDAEKLNVVNYIKEHNVAYFNDEMKDFLDESTVEKEEPTAVQVGGGYNNYDITDVNAGDPIFLQALWLAVNTGTVAVSQLQRRFRLGYGRAGALVDRMEQLKLVSGNEGSKARRVLITREEFIERYGPMDDTF